MAVSRLRSLFVLGFVLGAALQMPPARADIQPVGGETMLVPGALARIAGADDGSFVAAWSDSASPPHVYARRFNRDATPASEVIVVGEGQGRAVATDGNGNFVVVYDRYIDGTIREDVFARRFAASGAPLGPEFRVNSYTLEGQYGAAVAMGRRGDFVVAWQSWNQDGSQSGIYAQRYDAFGAAVGGEFLVNQATALSQDSAAVAIDDYGRFVITWSGLRSTSGSEAVDIFARRYAANGTALTGEFIVNTYILGPQKQPSIAMDPVGNFVIAWASWGQDADSWGVYARRFTHAGLTTASEFRVNTTTVGNQDVPFVGMNGAGFVVAWMDYAADRSTTDVAGQRYDRAGNPVGSEFRINTVREGWQHTAFPVMDDSGSIVVAWTSEANTGENRATYCQRYSYPGLGYVILADGQSIPDLTGPATSWRYFKLSVPPEQGGLNTVMSGGWGDADLYVKYGSPPDEASFDAAPYLDGNAEAVTFLNPIPGSWWLGVRGFNDYGGVSVLGDHGSGPLANEGEPNNSTTYPKVLTQSGVLTIGYIGSSVDGDYYRVSVAPGRTLRASLTVPITRNYDLRLYNSAGSYLKGSFNGTGSSESLTQYNGTTVTQTYYVSVAGASGSSSITMPYALTVTW